MKEIERIVDQLDRAWKGPAWHGPSVQEAVERAVYEVTGERVTMHSAGRTDSGVHALAIEVIPG